MKHLIFLLISIYSFSAYGQHKELTFVNTLVNETSLGGKYLNAFKLDKGLILLKDSIPYDSNKQLVKDYIFDWKQRNVPLENSNLFIMNTKLKKFKTSERTFLSEYGLDNTNENQQNYRAIQKENLVLKTETTESWAPIIYECLNNHTGHPHSGKDKEELKASYGCTKFQVKLL